MAMRGLTILVLVSLALPASAEKVAYLLDQSGQVTAHMEIYGQGQDSNTYVYDFSDTGPFFPEHGGTFATPSLFSGTGTQLITDYNIGDDSLPPSGHYFLVELSNQFDEAAYPYSGTSSLDVHWRFQVQDEPIDVSLTNYSVNQRPGTMTNVLTDETANLTYTTISDNEVQLQPWHIYTWDVDAQSSDWHGADFSSELYLGDGVLAVPEPTPIYLAGASALLLILQMRRRKHASAIMAWGGMHGHVRMHQCWYCRAVDGRRQ